MNRCQYAERWDAAPCTQRSECLSACRAGWLPEPVRCERCGVKTVGPLTLTLVDDGADLVVFRFACLRCAPLLEALDEAEARRYQNVMWMVPNGKER